MVFSSLTFLSVFLPITLLVYYVSPRKAKNAVLFLFSLVFYAWGEPVYILLMLFSTVVDYVHGLVLSRAKAPTVRKIALLSSIIINVGLLGFFKYGDFLVSSLGAAVGVSLPALDLPLPLGISFYTFQTMSYTIDVYRKNCPAQRNFIDFACYVSMFPQLVAGPIVRYTLVDEQLKSRKETLSGFCTGIARFSIGMAKKVLLANAVGQLWDVVIARPTGQISALTAILGVLAFAFQIFFDFSGYSDMAIGLGHMFGFTLPNNFNLPYTSLSVAGFWRNWHMTLTGWFREYIYIPLGGNRVSPALHIRNIMVVWLLTGLWHGASWNYPLWGLYFGVLLVLERYVWGTLLERLPKFFRWLYTALVVGVGWVLFAVEDIGLSISYLGSLFGANGFLDSYALYQLASYGIMLLVCALFSSSLPKRAARVLKAKRPSLHALLTVACCALGLGLSLIYVVGSGYNPFLYFRF